MQTELDTRVYLAWVASLSAHFSQSFHHLGTCGA